jgi:molybdopterin synthase sulfur carrier subunit
MPTVWIPSLLRDLTGRETVSASGDNVREIIESLEKMFPGIKARLCSNGGLRDGLAVVVDGQVGRRGLLQPVGEKSEVHFLPAISGG